MGGGPGGAGRQHRKHQPGGERRACGVVQTSPPGSRGKEDVHRWVETIDAAAIRCLRLLCDIISSGLFDLATLFYYILRVLMSSRR